MAIGGAGFTVDSTAQLRYEQFRVAVLTRNSACFSWTKQLPWLLAIGRVAFACPIATVIGSVAAFQGVRVIETSFKGSESLKPVSTTLTP